MCKNPEWDLVVVSRLRLAIEDMNDEVSVGRVNCCYAIILILSVTVQDRHHRCVIIVFVL